MVMLQRWSLTEGEWSCYRSGHQWRENGQVTDVVSLLEGEWSCDYLCHFNGGRMDVTEVVTLMEGQWSCYGGG